MIRRAAALLPFLAVLATATPASADSASYIVFDTGDPVGAACGSYLGIPNAFTCQSLRGAVAAANANPGSDGILLPTSGTYTLQQAPQLTLSDDVVIFGQSARATTIQGNGNARVLAVNADVTAGLFGLTISGGRAIGGVGGNIVNSGQLVLHQTRVRNGSATNGGGGIANIGPGDLVVTTSLIDGNTTDGDGGGILNQGLTTPADAPASLTISSSTIAFNHAGSGGGISTLGNTDNDTTLTGVTLAYNDSNSSPGGLASPSGGGTVQVNGSLFARNLGDSADSNCDRSLTGSGNLEDGNTNCGFGGNLNSGIGAALVDLGGHTDVLTIPATSPAKDRADPCFAGTDQRDAPRSAGGVCDAGAFEEGATAPAITPLTIPQPPPTPPPVVTPTPTPTPTATPTPTFGKTVVARPVSGKVRVRRPGSNQFVELDATQGIPLGSTVDTKAGTVQLTAQPKPGAKAQTGRFFDGVFRVTQSKTTTDLTLSEALAPCKKSKASAAAKKPKTRKLWGDGSGSFRTRGQYSAATVRGTKWLMQDTCAGTLTRVTKGTVSVRDNVRRKTIILRKGKSYLARPK